MRLILSILLLILNFETCFSQVIEIYPDQIDLELVKGVKQVNIIDKNTQEIKRTLLFDDKGRITQDLFFDYEPINGKVRIDGQYSFQYKENQELPYERIYTNSKDDTLKVDYYYSRKGNLTKRVIWEFERRTKLRKGAPDYHDGSPYGCIPAVEDIVCYRKWTVRQIAKCKYLKNKPMEVKTTYDYFREQKIWKFKYNNQSQLVEKSEFGKKSKALNIQEKYDYIDSLTRKTKEYFIPYSNTISLKEINTICQKENRALYIRTSYGSEYDYEQTDFQYDVTGKLVGLVKVKNNKVIFNYVVEYQ